MKSIKPSFFNFKRYLVAVVLESPSFEIINLRFTFCPVLIRLIISVRGPFRGSVRGPFRGSFIGSGGKKVIVKKPLNSIFGADKPASFKDFFILLMPVPAFSTYLTR